MSRFSTRSTEEEIMDDLECGGEVLYQTLRELETINKLLGGNKVTMSAIKRLVDTSVDKVWKIVDVGCGGGDMLMLIADWARKNEIDMELIGVDANPHVIEFAKSNCEDYPEISFTTQNIFSEEFKAQEFDILTATLFLHHFTDEELANLFKQFKNQCRVGLAINDLHRHWLAYRSINLLTSLFSKSSMVKNDAGVSVLRSFRREDWKTILNWSGIQTFSLKWMWAFRWQLIIHLRNF